MRGLDEVDRRSVVLGGATVLAAAVAGGVVAGAAAGLGRAAGGAKSPGGQSVTLVTPHPGASSASGPRPTTTVPGSTDSDHRSTGWDPDWPGQPGAGRRIGEFHRSEDG